MQCPQCGGSLADKAIACNAAGCGWEAPRSTGKTSAPLDPNRLLCVDEFRGQRCANLGTISPNTYPSVRSGEPHPGPWYCRDHYPPFRGAVTAGHGPRPKKPTTIGIIAEATIERLGIQNEGTQDHEPQQPTAATGA